MYPQQIHQYVRQFFAENNCPIILESDHYIRVQLTVDMDKRIMNRPFYWSYVESTGGQAAPAQLTFITDKSKLLQPMVGEVLHYGSPRLHQLFQVTREQGAFVQMYEKAALESGPQTILTPWLGVNYKITYSSDRTKETLYSLGMNLMTGAIVSGFQEDLSKRDVGATISANTFHLPYIIKPIRALERMDELIDDLIEKDDHTWVEEARARRKKDLRVLDYFYEDVEERPESYEREKQAIEEQYEAKILVDIINGGIFYLK